VFLAPLLMLLLLVLQYPPLLLLTPSALLNSFQSSSQRAGNLLHGIHPPPQIPQLCMIRAELLT